jgi:uncharacterized membrane protein
MAKDVNSITEDTLSWERVSSEVFVPRCVECHVQTAGNTSGVSLETYEEVVGNLDLIREQALVLKSMPPEGTLTDYQQILLSDWIDAGAPREGGPMPSPTPSGAVNRVGAAE